jgi:hypothetical protein
MKLLNLGNRQAAQLPTGGGCLPTTLGQCPGGLARLGPKRPGYQIISLIWVESIKVLKSPCAVPRHARTTRMPLPAPATDSYVPSLCAFFDAI